MMEEEFLMFKNYVASLGIVEIRWKCDDPTQFRPPEDLFERQSMGMRRDFGKTHSPLFSRSSTAWFVRRR